MSTHIILDSAVAGMCNSAAESGADCAKSAPVAPDAIRSSFITTVAIIDGLIMILNFSAKKLRYKCRDRGRYGLHLVEEEWGS